MMERLTDETKAQAERTAKEADIPSVEFLAKCYDPDLAISGSQSQS
jgi:hypothetical protein